MKGLFDIWHFTWWPFLWKQFDLLTALKTTVEETVSENRPRLLQLLSIVIHSLLLFTKLFSLNKFIAKKGKNLEYVT